MEPKNHVAIAIDAMGGDSAPDVNITGSLSALDAAPNLRVLLVGDRTILETELKRRGREVGSRLEIVHAEEVISMDDQAASAIRKKKGSSIHVGLGLLKENKADAFISAGNSGAVMGGALLLLGRLADVERPAIIIKFPTAEGFAIFLDAGANVECKPTHLYQFAQMGSVYAEIVEGVHSPRIGLLSNGSETHKGNELTREADVLLREDNKLNYVGYVEGRNLFDRTADVVVCDGFVGNVVLKSVEGLAETLFRWFRREIKKDFVGLVGVWLLRSLLRKFKGKFDYQPYGSAPLLGINGMVLISHGSSTPLAIHNGILTAAKAVEEEFLSKIAAQLHAEIGKTSSDSVT